jgi:hypothetical protein
MTAGDEILKHEPLVLPVVVSYDVVTLSLVGNQNAHVKKQSIAVNTLTKFVLISGLILTVLDT